MGRQLCGEMKVSSLLETPINILIYSVRMDANIVSDL